MATSAQDIIDQIDAAVLAKADGPPSITFPDGRQLTYDWAAVLALRQHYATKDRGGNTVPFGMARAKSGGVIV